MSFMADNFHAASELLVLAAFLDMLLTSQHHSGIPAKSRRHLHLLCPWVCRRTVHCVWRQLSSVVL